MLLFTPTMAEPNALLEEEPDLQVRHRMQHDDRIGFPEGVNEQPKGRLAVVLGSWSNSWSLPHWLTNFSYKPGGSITCVLNIGPLWLGNQAFPREHELTPIGTKQLDANICNKTREKNRGEEDQDLTICEVRSMFLHYRSWMLLPIKHIYILYLIWYCV